LLLSAALDYTASDYWADKALDWLDFGLAIGQIASD
jgi:hypothetical protein